MFPRKLLLTALVAVIGIAGGTSASADSVHYVFRMPIKGVAGPALPASTTNPPNGAQYEWLDRSEACPPGEEGSNTWQEVFETSPTYRPTGQIRDHQDTCMVPLGIPVLSGPSSAYPGAGYSVSWNAVPVATRYELRLNDGTTEGTVYNGPNTTAPRVASKTVGQTDHLTARACDATRCGDWSNSLAVTVANPPAPNVSTVTAPAIVIAGNSIDVSWTPSASPGGYPLWYTLKGHKDGETATTLYSGSAYSFSVLNANPAGTTYSFSLEACDTYNCSAATAASTLVNPPAPAAAPTLTAPASVYPSKNFTVSWTAVSGATSYKLIQNDNTASPAYSGANTSDAFTAGTTVGASYKFQVQACNVTGCSGLSTTKTVTVAQPLAPAAPATLTAPATVVVGGSIPLSWTASSSPQGYTLRYEVQTSTGGASVDVYSGPSTTTSISNATAGATYTSQVRTCDTYGCSGWTQATTVVNPPAPTAAPTLTAPASVYPDVQFIVSWNAPANAENYELQRDGATVYNGASLARAFTISGGVGASDSFAVRACNVTGCSGWSAAKVVTVANPPAPATPATLNAPSTVIAGGNIPLSWSTSSSPGGYALHYEVVYNTGAGNVSVYSGPGTSATITNAGPAGVTYANYVRACDTYNCSGWKQADTAVQAPVPGVPGISGGGNVYPSKGFTISWSGVSGATSYQLFQSGSLVYDGAGTSKAFTAGGTVGAVYPYQVKACNATGCSGLSSQVNVTVVNPPAPSTPSSLSVPSQVAPGGSMSVSWGTSSDPNGYAFTYRLYGRVNSGSWTLHYNGTGRSTTVTAPSTAGVTYNWIIRACSAYGCSADRTGATAVQVPIPGAPTVSAPGTVVAGAQNPVSWSATSWTTDYHLHVWWDSSTATLYAGSATSYSHTATTTVGLVYTYRVKACNSTGCSGWSAPVSTTVVAPPVPATPTLTAPGGVSSGSAINVSWSAVSGTTYYQLLGDAGTTASTLRYQGTSRSYSISTAMNRRDSYYTVSVRACNSTGCSGWRSATITVFGTG